ncbi:hypothetical protein F183_A54910 (plasmid) [Bryobacterales bacterium F-183]|nr:hypothetical protein F183_A54910 [Bryobacterales bacterium F-183]
MAELMGKAPEEISDADTRDTVESWSSLADVQLLHLVSVETGIAAEEELLGYESVGALLDELERRGAFQS